MTESSGWWSEGNWLFNPDTGAWIHTFRRMEIPPCNWYGPPPPRFWREPSSKADAALDALLPMPSDEAIRSWHAPRQKTRLERLRDWMYARLR